MKSSTGAAVRCPDGDGVGKVQAIGRVNLPRGAEGALAKGDFR